MRNTNTKTRYRFGFTAIELLISIGLMTTAASLMIPMFREYQINADLNTATEHIVQALRSAQTLSQTGKEDALWGVYFAEATIFAGDSYAERNADFDVQFPIASSIDTTGLSETTFTRVDGLPTRFGSVYVTSSVTDNYRRIDIDQSGVVSVSGLLTFEPGENPSDDGDEDSDNNPGGGDSSSSTSNDGSGSENSSAGTGGQGSAGSTASSSGNGTGGDSSSGNGNGNGEGTSSTSGTGNGNGDSDTPSCDTRYSLENGDVETVGTNDVKVRVLGSSITYGGGGPKVDVRLSASLDGTNWSDLFGGKAVNGSEQTTFENLPTETPVLFRFNGRYSWLFNKTFQSNAKDGHVIVLRNGDKAPSYAPFDHQESLESFLKGVLDAKGKITIGPRDLLFLVELGTLDRSSDFQDAVVLVTFTAKSLTCVDGDKERVKIHFDRVENMGSGDGDNRVYVGPNKLAFAADQWIPLVDSLGKIIVDNGLVEEVKGLALERGNGWVRIVSHGAHTDSGGKEIVDANPLFNHAIITGIDNDPENPSEDPRDGIVNDTSGGDEFVDGPNAKSMVFKTRTTTDDDGVILHWIKGNPSDSVSSSSAGTVSSSASSQASANPAGTTFTPDSCSVPYVIDSAGRITLKGKADITVKIVGSDSTYGERGPKMSIRSMIRFSDLSAWKQLFGNRSLKGGELSVFPDTASGSRIALSFNGRYSWVFNKTVESGAYDKHIHVLHPGETFEGLEAIESRGEMHGYLRNILDNQARMKIGNHDIAILVELGSMDRPDYHDAVVLVSIDRPKSGGGCAVSSSSSSQASSAGSSQSSTSSANSSANGNADTDGDSVRNADDLCPIGTTIPESVPTEHMTFDRLALTGARGSKDTTPVFRTGPNKKVSNYTLQDTRGCSCAQILDAIQDKGMHRFAEFPVLYRSMKNLFSFYVSDARKFGCSTSLLKMVAEDNESN